MGLFNWISKAPNKVVNLGKKVADAEQIESGGKLIIDMASSLSKTGERRETFENAYTRLNLTEEKLQDTYKFYSMRFYIFTFFLSVGLVALLYFIIGQSALSAMTMIGFIAICLSQMFSASFRMFQIRKRELLPVSEWVRNPSEWWIKDLPKKVSSSKNIIKKQ